MTQNQISASIYSLAALILLAPLVAMQFTTEVNWSLFDFTAAGTLLFSTAIACDITIRKVRPLGKSILLCGIILLVLLIIWAELAVGIFS
jgi:hypothetical protein